MRVFRAVRFVRRAPGYFFLSILTLALAGGANIVVFTLVSAIWLTPRPVLDPDRVAVISNLVVNGPTMIDMIRADRLEAIRGRPEFDGVAGQVNTGGLMGEFRAAVVLEPVGRYVETAAVTAGYFDLLGVAVTGRDFTNEDDRPGAEPAAVISHRLWQSAFQGRPSVIGSAAGSTHGPIRIVGVAARGFHGARLGEQFDLWVPARVLPRLISSASAAGVTDADRATIVRLIPFVGFARLRPGVTSVQAEQALQAADPKARYVVRPLAAVYGSAGRTSLAIDERLVLDVLAVTAGLVLIAGCATLAALVLVHYERRRHELAVRLALGSSRRRLAARLSIELVLVAATGGAAALFAAGWSLEILPALSLPGGVELDRLDLGVDGRVAAIGGGLCLLAMLLAGLAPLARFSRPALAASLTSPSAAAAAGSLRFRRALLSIHAAATLIVVVAAGLFVRTMQYGFGDGAGFDVGRTLFVGVQPGLSEFLDPSEGPMQPGADARKRAALQRFLESLAELPGTESVAIGSAPLLPETAAAGPRMLVIADGVERAAPFGLVTAGPGYSHALGLPLLAGRTLAEPDAGTGAALVTESFAAWLWPGASPVGRQFQRRVNVPRGQPQLTSYEVVGVVPDFVSGSLRQGGRAGVVLAGTVDDAVRGVVFGVVVRARARAEDLEPEVERVMAMLFPRASRTSVESGRDLVGRDLGRSRLGAWFFSAFGAIALCLGVAGVFGLVAYLSESRRREFGVRMALGARPDQLMRATIGAGLAPVALGVLVGLGVALVIARYVESLLHGVSRTDPVSYAAGAALLLSGAAAAGLLAAWRIRRLTPMDALRTE